MRLHNTCSNMLAVSTTTREATATVEDVGHKATSLLIVRLTLLSDSTIWQNNRPVHWSIQLRFKSSFFTSSSSWSGSSHVYFTHRLKTMRLKSNKGTWIYFGIRNIENCFGEKLLSIDGVGKARHGERVYDVKDVLAVVPGLLTTTILYSTATIIKIFNTGGRLMLSQSLLSSALATF